MNILIVVHQKRNQIGGSFISAIDSANRLANTGHNLIIILDKDSSACSIASSKVRIINYKHEKLWFFNKTKIINDITKKFSIDKIISFDRQSTYISAFISFVNSVKLVPVIPGGSKDQLPIEPVKIPTIVFSEENKLNLMSIYNWDNSLISVVPSRFDTHKFKSEKNFNKREDKIAYISRQTTAKRNAFISFCNEIETLKKSELEQYKIEVLGDGVEADLWKEITREKGLNIYFIGERKIDGEYLSNYKFIVSQGRSIIESICSSTPVAVCGEEGYKGMVKIDNFEYFASTNFTGRSIKKYSTLEKDICTLQKKYLLDEELRNYVVEKYDLKNLCDACLNSGTVVTAKDLFISGLKVIQNKLQIN